MPRPRIIMMNRVCIKNVPAGGTFRNNLKAFIELVVGRFVKM